MGDASPSRFELLMAILTPMSSAQLSRILKYAQGQTSPLSSWINPVSDLVNDGFVDEFESRLRAHHALQSKPLGRLPFEDAFRAACTAAGYSVGPSLGATASYIDLTVDGKNLALKTTSARDVKRDFAHISKLCEAAWIQDVRSAIERERHTKQLFRDYLGITDRLFQLRVLPDEEEWIYQLLEVPMELFSPILMLSRDSFQADGPTVRVLDNVGYCLTLKLDRSDAKITIARIPLERCEVHGEWRLPKVLD